MQKFEYRILQFEVENVSSWGKAKIKIRVWDTGILEGVKELPLSKLSVEGKFVTSDGLFEQTLYLNELGKDGWQVTCAGVSRNRYLLQRLNGKSEMIQKNDATN